MNEIKIGLLGAVITDENNGCLALTYSLMNVLEDISRELNQRFSYIIFQEINSIDSIECVHKMLGIDKCQLKIVNPSYLWTLKRRIHYPLKAMQTYKIIKECNIVIDLTAGDSFTDIYGQDRFDNLTNLKSIVIKAKKKLILGPQTYGPFLNRKNLNRAIAVIDKSSLVISRDIYSSEYIKKYTDKRIFTTTDLAFNLPFDNIKKSANSKIKIGVNVSGLLTNEKREGTILQTKIRVDYDEYIIKLVEYLLSQGKYDIYVIPHVGDDGGKILEKVFPELNYISSFDNPISAKNLISQMDIFIGARMHATIASLSSGVATIPTSYSRKFEGVFKTIDYNYNVDLTKMTTSKALDLTINYINDYLALKKKAEYSSRLANEKNNEFDILIKKEMRNLL